MVVLHFCSEGDNIPHAVAMAEAVNSSLSILPVGDDETDGSLPGEKKQSSSSVCICVCVSVGTLTNPVECGSHYT